MGLLLIEQQHYRSENSIERLVSLLDAGSKKMVRGLPWPESTKFADSGKAACGVLGEEWHRTVECWGVDTGTRLAATDGWTDPILQPALHGKRIILSDYGRAEAAVRVRPVTRWPIQIGRAHV